VTKMQLKGLFEKYSERTAGSSRRWKPKGPWSQV
jgi:hypothetical protein